MDGRFRPALEMMRAPRPSDAEYARLVENIRSAQSQNEYWSAKLAPALEKMLDLVYSGNEAIGWKLLQETWPVSDEIEFDAFAAELRERMRESPYSDAVKALNAPASSQAAR
jgi:hypothetical protein